MFDNEQAQHTQMFCTVSTKYAKVCQPVSIRPFAKTGEICVKCCGKPEIIDDGKCCGKPDAKCKFAISQKIRIDIPVEFGADVKIGCPLSECEDDKDCDCKKDDYDDDKCDKYDKDDCDKGCKDKDKDDPWVSLGKGKPFGCHA